MAVEYCVNMAMTSIFISYRHNDTESYTGRLYERLLSWFDVEDVFFDQSGIESGDDFPAVIQNALDSAQVFLVVIGPSWLSQDNRTRLDDEKDFVRHEVLCALKRREGETENKPLVIPVLVGGATQPAESELPVALQHLAFLQSHSIGSNFDAYTQQTESLCALISKKSRTWVIKLLQAIQSSFLSVDLSYVNFGQNLSVLNPGSHYIERKAANIAMDNWWAGWSTNPHPFVLLGEEGDGKSWALASWLAKKATETDFNLPVLWIPAFIFCTANTRGIEEAIVDSLERLLTSASKRGEELFGTLLQKPREGVLQFLLVVDGLNERPSLDWRAFFDAILAPPFLGSVAVMVTCRSVYWKSNLATTFGTRTAAWTLPPFNESELDTALARLNDSRENFSPKVLELVAKPRYFSLAVRLRKQLEDAGDDITPERLIYEDWRDLISRKRGLEAPMSHEDFLGLITGLVGTYGDRISAGALGRELASYGGADVIKTELVTTGILEQKAGRFVVSPTHLVLGFGLLLANEIEVKEEAARQEIEELIAKHMEPHSDMDLKVQIKAMAFCHSLLTEGFPELGRLTLFNSWIHGRNLDEADMERICAYLPLCPEIYFQATEELWKGGHVNRQAQDLFMVSFLRHAHLQRVRAVMITAFERWLGFVYPYGHMGQFEKGEEERIKLKRDVEKRLGVPAIAGEMDLYGYHLEVVEDVNLLRLGQVAVSVISHLDREPFIRTLVTGVVATAVMGGSNTEFSWVVRTASPTVQQFLYQVAKHLVCINEATACNAADRLLLAICNEESVALRKNVPEEHALTSRKKELQINVDISDSPWFFWNEETYLDCLQKTQLHPLQILDKLREVALNPDCALPASYIEKLGAAWQQLDLSQIRSNFGQTREDISLRDIEPALCTYYPQQYKELISALINTLPDRNTESRRLLAYKLYEHLPVLGEDAYQVILDVWRDSLQNQDKAHDDAETALFPLVFWSRPASEQFALLMERKGKGVYTVQHPPIFKPFDACLKPSIEQALVDINTVDSEKHYTVLWYLQNTVTKLDEWLRQLLIQMFASGDSVTRYCCMEIICKTDDRAAADMIVDTGWRVENGEQCPLEVDWGSILLSRFASALPFAVLAARIAPQWFGYAAHTRGNNPGEVEEYAQLLHTLWSRTNQPSEDVSALLRHVKVGIPHDANNLIENLTVELNRDGSIKMSNCTWGGSVGMVDIDEVKRAFDFEAANNEWKAVHAQVLELFDKEKKLGNYWIEISHMHMNLDVVVENTTYWREWITPVLSGSRQGRFWASCSQGFYEGLCAALLNHDPETGLQLFDALLAYSSAKHVDALTDIQHLYFDLFAAKDSPQVDCKRRQLLNDCNTDQALFEIMYLAQWHKKGEWVDSVIEQYTSSNFSYDIARGLRLLGFSNEGEHGMWLQKWIDGHKSSWLMDVANLAQACSKRNLWARVWFAKFIAEMDRVKAWSAFRLFLRCVDKRFWMWGDELLEGVTDLPGWKRDAYTANIEVIKNAIKDNEKMLNDTFISHKVNENQLWPWMKRYNFE